MPSQQPEQRISHTPEKSHHSYKTKSSNKTLYSYRNNKVEAKKNQITIKNFISTSNTPEMNNKELPTLDNSNIVIVRQ